MKANQFPFNLITLFGVAPLKANSAQSARVINSLSPRYVVVVVVWGRPSEASWHLKINRREEKNRNVRHGLGFLFCQVYWAPDIFVYFVFTSPSCVFELLQRRAFFYLSRCYSRNDSAATT